MIELSESIYRISIREFEDMESESEKAWIVDLLDTNGNCIIEGAGVAGTLMAAMGEAGKAITLHLTYDINNNCVVCDQYIYDQHKKNCEHYIKESYSKFLKRIQKEEK
jgi:hypothetical protein